MTQVVPRVPVTPKKRPAGAERPGDPLIGIFLRQIIHGLVLGGKCAAVDQCYTAVDVVVNETGEG